MILITGGLGFIGTATVQALIELGEECVLIQRRAAEIPEGRFSRPVTAVQGDVKDSQRCARSVANIRSPASFTWPDRCRGPPTRI
jgi:nucleoside-diphosphate-sugar epimerase